MNSSFITSRLGVMFQIKFLATKMFYYFSIYISVQVFNNYYINLLMQVFYYFETNLSKQVIYFFFIIYFTTSFGKFLEL